MATLTRRVSKSANIGGTTYIAYVMVTLTYTQTTADKTVSITASNVSVSSVSYQGGTNVQNRNTVKGQLADTLSSATVTATFGGQTLFSKYSLAIGGSYSVSGTKSVSRGTSATTATLAMSVAGGTASTTITVPALPNWAVTFYGNTGTSVPSPQTKFLDINLPLTNAQPNKDDYTFRGWATSAERAGVPNIDWSGGQVYQTNAKLDLYAIWERNYRKPTINHLDVDRCDVDGELNDDGTYALVTFEWGVFRTNDTLYVGGSTTPYANNSVSLCEITVGSHTATLTLTGQSGTASIVVGNDYIADSSYEASVSITDSQVIVSDNTVSVTGQLPKATFPMDINKNATAIAFFSTAPDDKEGAFFGKNVDAPTYTINGIALIDFFRPVGSYYETSLPSTPTSGHSYEDDNLTNAEIADCGNSWFDPRIVWGGTWVKDSAGRVTVAIDTSNTALDTIGETGGNTDAIIPYHNHGFTNPTIASSGAHVHTLNLRNAGTTGNRATNNVTYGASGHDYQNSNPVVSSGSHSHSYSANGSVGYAGTNRNTINANLQPYIVVNRWHRTA